MKIFNLAFQDLDSLGKEEQQKERGCHLNLTYKHNLRPLGFGLMTRQGDQFKKIENSEIYTIAYSSP